MTDGLPIHVDDVPAQAFDSGIELALTRRRLGVAAGAAAIGVALIEIPPGRRSSPPHSHIDEEEQFFVLAGGGISYQTSGSKDVHAYPVSQGDVLWHLAGGPAHTLIAGPDGLTVLAVGEGSRTGLVWLPRTEQFRIGPRWSPADSPPPFVAETALGPLPVPEPSAEPHPPVPAGDARLVLRGDVLEPGAHATALHFHSTREEAWFVLSGSGTARIGAEGHPLRAGSFWLRRPNGGVGHRVEAGPEGMELLTMGDLVAADVVAYPEKGIVRVARGVELPYAPG